MKKEFIKKVVIIGGICLVCIGVIVGTLWQKPSPEFEPDNNSSTIITTSMWNEPLDKNENPASLASSDTTHSENNYSTISETEKEVIIEMTSLPEKSNPPVAPEGQSIIDDNFAQDTSPDEECIPSTPKEKAVEKDKVVDPVFGLTEVPSASGQEADSPGDPNKIIGFMD